VRTGPAWSLAVLGPLLFLALGPGLLAYVLWDVAVRRGNVTLCAIAAYATPLLSTAITCILLGVLPGAKLWIGCGLVVIGAVLCRIGVRDAPSRLEPR